MAQGQTTITEIPAAVRTFYDKALLARALPTFLHQLFGQMRPIPKNSGDQVKFRRYNSFSAATAPLVEGTTPTPVKLVKVDITASLKQYGNVTQVTDMVEWTNQDPVLAETTILLGENSSDTLDLVYRAVLVAGTSVRYVGAVAGRSSLASRITSNDLDVVIRALKNNNAKFFTKMINPSTGYGSSSIRASFWAIVHPDVEFDLDSNITDWIPVNEYSAQKETYESEIGSYKNVRFVSSTNAFTIEDSTCPDYSATYRSADGTYATVYRTLIFAQNAYGVCPLSGENLKMYHHPRGSGNDILEQYSTHGWKSTVVAKILDETLMYGIESLATE